MSGKTIFQLCKRVFAVAVICLLLLYTLTDTVTACTIFTMRQDDTILVGNNEDWMYSYPSTGWITKGNDTELSRICFGNSSYIQGGMNEAGLCYDGATCPASQVPHDDNKESLSWDFGEVILSHCATVQEAIDFLGRYNMPASNSDHLLLADALGDSAVIEWVNNEMRVIRKSGDYQICSNYYISEPDLGGYPCERYQTADSLLQSTTLLTAQSFELILSQTAQDWGEGGTKYSNIYDLPQREVLVYKKGDFSQNKKFSLEEELAKMDEGETYRFDLDELAYSKTEADADLEEDTPAPGTDSEELPTPDVQSAPDEDIPAPNEQPAHNFLGWAIGIAAFLMAVCLCVTFFKCRKR